MNKDTEWWLLKVTEQTSRYGGSVETLTFANTDWQIAHTYLDESNFNYQHWRNLLRAYDRGWGVVVKNLNIKPNQTYKKTGEPLINADSRPQAVKVEEDFDKFLADFVRTLESTR